MDNNTNDAVASRRRALAEALRTGEPVVVTASGEVEKKEDDLTFMADTIGIEAAMSLDDNYLTVYQEEIDKTTKLYFMLSVVKHAIILSYEDKCYVYRRGLFTDAFKKAKSERDKKENVDGRIKQRKQAGIVDSVIKIIRFNRNEE